MLRVYNDKIFVCGVDEVGRGCLAGPVTAAAVILPKKYKNPLIKDSKKLNKNTRLDLYNEIIEIIGSSNPSNNINFCFLSKDYSYVIESCGMNQKGKVVFL